MKGSELRDLRERLTLTQEAAAASVGVSARTWQRWEASKKAIPNQGQRLVRLVYPKTGKDAKP
jgi:DNA-binding transcriptional regulator YiaG